MKGRADLPPLVHTGLMGFGHRHMFSIISEIGQRGGSRYFLKHSDIKKFRNFQKGGGRGAQA